MNKTSEIRTERGDSFSVCVTDCVCLLTPTNDSDLESDLQTAVFSPPRHQSDLLLQHPLLVSPVLTGYLYS